MGASDRWSVPVRPKRRRGSKRNFYAGHSLTEAERVELRKAAEVENLGDEIALLRVRLKKAMETAPDTDLALMVRGMDTLVKAVAAQYRLSPRAKKDLSDNFAAVFNSLGDHILPADR